MICEENYRVEAGEMHNRGGGMRMDGEGGRGGHGRKVSHY